MLKTTVVLFFIVAKCYAGFASSSAGSGLYNNIPNNIYADKYPYIGFGGSGGYTSNYVSTGHQSNPFISGFAPFAPLPQLPNPYFNANNQFALNNQLYQQLQSNFANLWQQQFAHQSALQNSIQNSVRHPGVYGSGGTYTSTSYYPGHSVVHNRFGGEGGGVQVSHSSGRPGFSGLSTSSFSSSSDLNGVKSGHQESITSINDNGKVTTYRFGS